ncbi:hypothetical protein [Saccharopolyspora sp. NPDC002686]|uniref:hypothetical protein n=1 Tax=Saccharopolyspora sp. NPDC002686 TaxID=3154541 RepID=UPI003318FE8B
MTYTDADESAVPPREIRSYLDRHGWSREERIGDRFEVWATGQGTDASEVLLPLNTRASDYSRRIRNLFSDLSNHLQISISEVEQEISQGSEDRIAFSMDGEGIQRGRLPLSDTTQAYNQISKIVVASACSTLRRRSYHGRSRPKAARDMAKRLQAVAPESGSYVIPLVNDLPSLDSFHEDPTLDLNVESERTLFPRRVLGTLHSSLNELSELASQKRVADGQALTTAVLEGLSSETCAAISKILNTEGIARFDINFGWATNRRKPATINRFSFSVDQAAAVARIGQRLRRAETVSDEVIYGTVVALKRPVSEDDGDVTVSAVIDDNVRNVRMTLNDRFYRVASQANSDRARVVVSGELLRPASGNYKMTRVDSFKRDSATRF